MKSHGSNASIASLCKPEQAFRVSAHHLDISNASRTSAHSSAGVLDSAITKRKTVAGGEAVRREYRDSRSLDIKVPSGRFPTSSKYRVSV
jgi:hypothetical protein